MKTSFSPVVLCVIGGVAVLAVAVLILFAWQEWDSAASADAPSFPRASMTIQCADGKKFPFDIEVATTPEQETYGLMFRRSLPRDAGMLFLWPEDRMVIMWMKNTFISLDMLYVGSNGVITKIITSAEPLSLMPLSSDVPVRAVIEINAGETVRRGLKPGDKVIYPAFGSGP
jgi:uncharacterized membrane protein (UPF0127 family)